MLGIVVQDDGGLLFGLAITVAVCSVVTLVLHRRQIPFVAEIVQTAKPMNTQSSANRELIQSVIETLRQGEMLLAEITDENYTRKVPVAFNASIGGHYRHCLDHFRTLARSGGSR